MANRLAVCRDRHRDYGACSGRCGGRALPTFRLSSLHLAGYRNLDGERLTPPCKKTDETLTDSGPLDTCSHGLEHRRVYHAMRE
jgi:hypothetical protein